MEKEAMKAKSATFLELVEQFPLRPIRTRTQHAKAIKMLLKIAAREESGMTRDEIDYFETLAQLVQSWEKANVIDDFVPLTGTALVKFLMNERGMNVSALGKIIGSQSAASLVLSGKRELSKAMIAALAEYFKLNPGAFLPARRKAS